MISMKTDICKTLKSILCVIPFLLVTLSFSQDKSNEFKIIFSPNFNGEEIVKDKWYVSKTNDSIRLSKLKFYVTDFKVKATNEKEYPLIDSNHLIDIFNKETLTIIRSDSIYYKATELSFKIGVKESLNISGANSGDLDPSKGMFWSWQSGYINFKVEGVSPSCKTRKNKFQFHIGGYQKPYATVRTLTFPLKKEELKINFNVATLFKDIQLNAQNQIMIPGEDANTIANKIPTLFSLDE
jgi:hypothetical protein